MKSGLEVIYTWLCMGKR